MRFTSLQLKEIRHALNLAEIIGRQVSLKISGGRLKGRCPFHDEKTPSFFVDPAQGRYYCFGCQARGDVFDYFMNMEGLTFPQAVERAAREAGYDLKELDPKEEEALRKRETRRARLYALNELATSWFEEQLRAPCGGVARAYLTDRGIHEASWARYRLGYALDSWDSLCSWLTPQQEEDALTLGLIRPRREGKGGYDFYRHRIMFPIRDSSGRVRGFSSRRLDPERNEGKYVNSPESEIFRKHSALYGLYNAKRSIRKRNMAILVEGNLDVISMAQEGFEQTVAPLGTAITSNQMKLLKRFTGSTVLMLDGDNAGRSATLKTIELMVRSGMGGRVVLLPEEEDPDTILIRDGRQGVERLLKTAQPPLETYFTMVLPPISATSTEKLNGLSGVAPLLTHLSDAHLRVYAQEIGIRLGIDQKEVLSVLEEEHKVSWEPRNTRAKRGIPKKEEVHIDADILALLHIAVLGLSRNSTLPVEQLSAIGNSFSNSVALDLWRVIAHLPLPISHETWQEILGPYFQRYLEISASFEDDQVRAISESEKDEALLEVVLNLRKRGVVHRAKMLDVALQSAKVEGDRQRIDALRKEKLELQKERIELQS